MWRPRLRASGTCRPAGDTIAPATEAAPRLTALRAVGRRRAQTGMERESQAAATNKAAMRVTALPELAHSEGQDATQAAQPASAKSAVEPEPVALERPRLAAGE